LPAFISLCLPLRVRISKGIIVIACMVQAQLQRKPASIISGVIPISYP